MWNFSFIIRLFFFSLYFFKLIPKHIIRALSTSPDPFQELDLPGVTSSGWWHIVHRGVSFCSCLAFLHVPNKFFFIDIFSSTFTHILFPISFFWSEFVHLVFLIDFFLVNIWSYLYLLIKFFCWRYHQYNRYGYLMRENMLCAGEEGKDSCSGNSSFV